VLLACSAPQQPPPPAASTYRSLDVSNLELDGWHALRSPDFVLYSNSTVADLEAFATDLARFIAVIERLVSAEPPKTPARVFLLDENIEDLLVRTNLAAAYASPSLTGYDLVIRDTSRYDPVKRAIFLHEFTHYLTMRSRTLLYPAWYEEGFAEFLSTIRKRGNTMEVGSVPRLRLEQLGDLQKYGRDYHPLDLKPVLAWTRASGTMYPRGFYATSWITVHYLNSDPERQRQLATMLQLQGQGLEWQEAFDRAFPESIDDLERKIHRHGESLVTGTPGAVLYLPLEALDVRTEWTIRAVPRPEIARILAEFALRGAAAFRGPGYSMRIAEALLAETLAADPDDARAIAGLAEALAGQDRFEESRARIVAFEAVPDPPVEAFVHAGRAIEMQAASLSGKDYADERKQLYESAIPLYESALAKDPANPTALAGLGRSQLETGRLDEARTSLARTLERGEWNGEITLDRARVEQKAGSIDQARDYLQEVMRLAGDEYADEVNAMLEELDEAAKDPGSKSRPTQ
jgi:tetratricopeptide (TPR) repeat protein